MTDTNKQPNAAVRDMLAKAGCYLVTITGSDLPAYVEVDTNGDCYQLDKDWGRDGLLGLGGWDPFTVVVPVGMPVRSTVVAAVSKPEKSWIVAVDFDGTCVTHEYPDVGKSIGAEPVLKKLVASGARLILFTMRSGDALVAAVEWFKANGIPLWGANANPEQYSWTDSPKPYAHIYIDDSAIGVPLQHPMNGNRPFVDWEIVEKILVGRGIIQA